MLKQNCLEHCLSHDCTPVNPSATVATNGIIDLAAADVWAARIIIHCIVSSLIPRPSSHTWENNNNKTGKCRRERNDASPSIHPLQVKSHPDDGQKSCHMIFWCMCQCVLCHSQWHSYTRTCGAHGLPTTLPTCPRNRYSVVG